MGKTRDTVTELEKEEKQVKLKLDRRVHKLNQVMERMLVSLEELRMMKLSRLGSAEHYHSVLAMMMQQYYSFKGEHLESLSAWFDMADTYLHEESTADLRVFYKFADGEIENILNSVRFTED